MWSARLIGVVVAAGVGSVALWSLQTDRVDAAPSQCMELNSSAQATLRRVLPRQWRLKRTAVSLSTQRTRQHDGAPVSYVAAELVDVDGNLASAIPAVWVWEGGADPKHDRWPKRIMNLNESAVRIVEAGYQFTEDGALANGRRRIPDARSIPMPYTPDDPEVKALLACFQ